MREFARRFAAALAEADPKRFTVGDVETLLERAKSSPLASWGVADQRLPAIR